MIKIESFTVFLQLCYKINKFYYFWSKVASYYVIVDPIQLNLNYQC